MNLLQLGLIGLATMVGLCAIAYAAGLLCSAIDRRFPDILGIGWGITQIIIGGSLIFCGLAGALIGIGSWVVWFFTGETY